MVLSDDEAALNKPPRRKRTGYYGSVRAYTNAPRGGELDPTQIKAILVALRGIKIRDIDKALVILSKGERRS